MKVQRLVAFSTSAVIAAACSSGGSAPVPHATAANTSVPSAKNHAPNATLTLTLPTNYVRVKSAKTAARTLRRPAFIDPSSVNVLQVEVTTYNDTLGEYVSYMAATDVPVSVAASSQSIPIYLAPGYDTVLVQETGSYDHDGAQLTQAAGYLLSQGENNVAVSAGESPNVSVVMQLVLGTMNYTYNAYDESYVGLSGVAIVDDPTTYQTVYPNFMPTGLTTGLPSTCVSNQTTLYFLPTDDENGTYAYQTSGGAGNVQAGAGFPQSTITWTSLGGTSGLVAQPFGGYTTQFDTAGHPIVITDAFSSVVLDPYTYAYTTYGYVNSPSFGPYDFSNPSVVTPQIGGSNVAYSVTVGETGVSPGCSEM
jgi:hypothetical protein